MPLNENLPYPEEQILAMFDSFCKNVVKNARRNMNRKRLRHKRHEVLNPHYEEKAKCIDYYPSDDSFVQAGELSCKVKNELLSEAMNSLPENRRGAIILEFWRDFDDKPIANYYHVDPRTVRRWRKQSITDMKQFFLEAFINGTNLESRAGSHRRQSHRP